MNIKRIVFSSILIVSLLFTGIGFSSAKASFNSNGPLVCDRSGWSSWQTLTLSPQSYQVRTISFFPKRAGQHLFQFRSSFGTNLKVVPKWFGSAGSGTWGPYYSFNGVSQIITLQTGDKNVSYQFQVSEIQAKISTIYFRVYCSPK